jgi:hypothetical protein
MTDTLGVGSQGPTPNYRIGANTPKARIDEHEDPTPSGS